MLRLNLNHILVKGPPGASFINMINFDPSVYK